MKHEQYMTSKIGSYAFIFGILLAIIAGFFDVGNWVAITLAILGIVVGLLNVTARESTPYLVATIALMLGSTALSTVFVALKLAFIIPVLSNIIVFIAPGAAIVALKAIYALASSE